MGNRVSMGNRLVSIHALLAECDPYTLLSIRRLRVSIHALLAECDMEEISDGVWAMKFQSTHSLRSATILFDCLNAQGAVSIHALLAECDEEWSAPGYDTKGFNPRTPCGVRLSFFFRNCKRKKGFQSTHSLRSATRIYSQFGQDFPFQSTHSLRSATSRFRNPGAAGDSFNPRTPCGVRPYSGRAYDVCLEVSIHALLAECDLRFPTAWKQWNRFQSTHSLRSATSKTLSSGLAKMVSIHALLAECDKSQEVDCITEDGFNPRTPCGVRQGGKQTK